MSYTLFLFLTLADDYACFSLFYCIFVPLKISDLRSIILQGKKYPELYRRFETAYNSNEVHPKTWYDNFIKID